MTAPDLVVLLDETGHPIGTADRRDVHGARTPLHLAFSLYLFDSAGRLLLTRRAVDKRTFPGIWTNTCCGHPRPSEPVAEAACRRVAEELGITLDPGDLVAGIPHFRYTATDRSGIIENELCPVFWARVPDDTDVRPASSEVADWRWLPWPEVVRLARTEPEGLSPWAVLQVAELADLFPSDGPA